MRAGRINLIGIVLAVALIFGGVWAYTFLPYKFDHLQMNECVKGAARSWHQMSVVDAKRRLSDEMYNRDVPDYIQEDMCEFKEEVATKTVRCEWNVIVVWPIVGKEKPLHYVSEATLYSDGRVR